MRTKITRILQVGDIHLPEWPAKHTDIDLKDKSFSQAIVEDLTQDRLSLIFKALNKVANSGSIDAVILMGDFTSKGQIEHIAPAVEIFSTLLQDENNSKQPTIMGVPGNHDVSKDAAASHGPIGKFGSIRDAFVKFGLLDPPVEDCVIHHVNGLNGSELEVCLLNTSIGSMSIHLLPPHLQQEFDDEKLGQNAVDLLGEEPIESAQPEFGPDRLAPIDRLDQLYSQLDTPYVSKGSLNTLLDHMNDGTKDCVVVCAHHNLLPQRIPRISPYSEMLNAGFFRESLLSSGRNVVFLHGHIHEDPVEQIVQTSVYGESKPDTRIVSISAPPIWDGFNEIGFFHDDNNDVFLMRLTEYRPDKNGRIGNFTDQRTRFFPLVADNSVLMSKNARKLWDRLRDKTRLNWGEALELCADFNVDEDEFEHLLMLLFCSASIEIVNLGKPRHKWRIISVGGA